MGVATARRACKRGWAKLFGIHPSNAMPTGSESTMNGCMAGSPDGFTRTSGLRLLLVIVFAGIGIPALFRWKAYDLERDRDRLIANAPSTGEGRLALWFSQVQPRVVEGLRGARFSSSQPWLVSHVVSPASASEPPQVWGVDLTEVPPHWVSLSGLQVFVDLPAPKLLTRDVLVGDNVAGVQIFPAGSQNDGVELTRARVRFVLKRLIEALPRDIEGAEYVIRVGGR